MKIDGKIETIIFSNKTNGWTVLLLKSGKDYTTATGQIEDIEVGDEIELDGEFVVHKVYGEQFKFENYKKLLPKTNSALIQYIADNIKGVGKKTATNIINTFGDDAINVIRFNPEKLREVKGLNLEKIENLNTFFNEEWDKWNSIEYLSNLGISVLVASRIYKALGNETIKIVKENPYSLISFVKSIDFKLVDEIGKKLGLSLDNEDRIDTGILYALGKVTEFGHTCIDLDKLVDYSMSILNVDEQDIINGIARLKFMQKIYTEDINQKEFVFRRSLYLAEENIAKSIIDKTRQSIKIKNYDKQIEKVSDVNSLVLSDEQKQAISTCLNNYISVITGGPGTGKTTIIKCIIDILENLKKEYVLCAPTGRAAKRIKETTGKEAKTLHRLLEITKVENDNLDMFLDIMVRPIEAEVVIIDEASMIDTMMMNNIIKALKVNTKLILVGDVNQLPSVGAGAVLKDIIDSNCVNTVYLKKIYRQSAKSDIIVNAHRVNDGIYPEFKTKDTDLFFYQTDSVSSTLDKIDSVISEEIDLHEDVKDAIDILKNMQILTPMKKTELGTIQLNEILQEKLNKKDGIKIEKKFGDKTFRVSDKVMQIVNNYDKKFSIDGKFFDGVFNGDIGYITKIDNLEEKLYVLFDDEKEVEYDFDELDQLEHAYAITIHKSQGSEFDFCILPIYIGYPKLFTRNLLYTAMTRAKKKLVIIGSKKMINYMVDNVDSKNRNTGLKQKIINNL